MLLPSLQQLLPVCITGGVSLPLLWILPHDALLLLVTCTRWWCGLGVFLLLQLQLGLGQAL